LVEIKLLSRNILDEILFSLFYCFVNEFSDHKPRNHNIKCFFKVYICVQIFLLIYVLHEKCNDITKHYYNIYGIMYQNQKLDFNDTY